jgi:hypothetical protein
MDTLFQQLLCLLKEGAGEDDDARCAVSNFVVLRLGKFDLREGAEEGEGC